VLEKQLWREELFFELLREEKLDDNVEVVDVRDDLKISKTFKKTNWNDPIIRLGLILFCPKIRSCSDYRTAGHDL
jgi:hypothetical protein